MDIQHLHWSIFLKLLHVRSELLEISATITKRNFRMMGQLNKYFVVHVSSFTFSALMYESSIRVPSRAFPSYMYICKRLAV